MANRVPLPFGPGEINIGQFQLWHYQIRQYVLENRIDLTDNLHPDFLQFPIAPDANRLPISIYQFMDHAAIRGRLVYNGGGTLSAPVAVIDVTSYNTIWSNYSTSGVFPGITIFRPSASPNAIIVNEWACDITQSGITPELLNVRLVPAAEGTPTLETDDEIYIDITLYPYDVNYA